MRTREIEWNDVTKYTVRATRGSEEGCQDEESRHFHLDGQDRCRRSQPQAGSSNYSPRAFLTSTLFSAAAGSLAQMSNVQLSSRRRTQTSTPSTRRPTAAAPLSESRAAETTRAAAALGPSLVGGSARGTSTHSWRECRRLVGKGVKELVLLGQNVNSQHDKSAGALQARPEASCSTSSPGFDNLYRLRGGGGYYFADLVAAVSDLSPELRVRFTSPHPKDFPPPTSWRSSLGGPTSASPCTCPRRAAARFYSRLLRRDGGRAPGHTVTREGSARRPGVRVRVLQREKTMPTAP